jgi:hypothetical protein
MYSFDVGNNKVSNRKLFSDFMVDGVKCGPDACGCDVDGNLWVSSNAGRAVGYSGDGVDARGQADRPHPPAGGVRGNICFGGPKRNRLFMAASQSLYALYVATQGARPVKSRDYYVGRRASRLSQEAEVAAVLGLEHVIHVEFGVAPREASPTRSAARRRALGPSRALEPALVDAQANAVTALDERERPADGRLGRACRTIVP